MKQVDFALAGRTHQDARKTESEKVLVPRDSRRCDTGFATGTYSTDS